MGFVRHANETLEYLKWIALAQSDLHFFHSAHLSPDQKDGYEERRGVGRRSGKGDSVDPQEQRKDQYKRDQEEDLSCHGEQKSFQWFSDGGKKLEEIIWTPFTRIMNRKMRIKRTANS